MKNRYIRRAWYLDEDVLIEGVTDKRGFHPNYGIECGFSNQCFSKKDIGKIIFYQLEEAFKICGKIEVISS